MGERPVIVAAIDFSPVAERVASEAAQLARAMGARLTLLHVTAPRAGTRETARLEDEERARTESLARSLRMPGLEVRAHVQVGDAAEEILRELDLEPAQMLVLGTHGRKGLGRFLIGSVADEMMHRAPCPVLVVREHALAKEKAS